MSPEREPDSSTDQNTAGDAAPPQCPESPQGASRGGHDGHARCHASPWIITYSDMITLLMALFICIITFSNQGNSEGAPRKRAAVLYDSEGLGVAAAASQKREAGSVVWREVPAQTAAPQAGSETPPRYSDPVQNATAQVLRMLEAATAGTLEDSWTLRLPFSLLFAADGQLSESGSRLLQALARNLRALPYDIQVQMDSSAHMAQGIALAQYLVRREGLHPSRIGVGVQPSTDGRQRLVWLTFAHRSGE